MNLRPACVAAILLAFAAPRDAGAHGELLIRIAAVTRQIDAATNNPAPLYLQRGELHREHQDWDAARVDYDHAARLDPDLAEVDFCRARMLADSGQPEAARTMFDLFLTRAPKEGVAYVGRARVLLKLGDRKAAIEDYRRGLELLTDPQPEYFLELAQALAAGKQSDEALRSLDAGIKIFGPIVLLQGYALDLELERNRTDAALARLDTIIKTAFRKESWFARRGDILLAAGRRAEARKAYEASLAAVRDLPGRLQQSPSMLELQSRVNEALAGINRKSSAAK